MEVLVNSMVIHLGKDNLHCMCLGEYFLTYDMIPLLYYF